MTGTQEEARVPVTAAIRPSSAADAGALADFFAGLSVRTRYLRFFAPVTPGPGMLRALSGADGRAEVVVAVRGGVIIGHAMAADQAGPRGARAADAGVVVADAWQGQGVGPALMRALAARAWARGVTSLTMDVLPGNHRMLAIIAAAWPAARAEDSGGFRTFHCPLPPQRQRPQAQPAVLAAAG